MELNHTLTHTIEALGFEIIEVPITNGEQTWTRHFVALDNGLNYVHLRQSPSHVEFTLVQSLDSNFGSSVTVYHARAGFGFEDEIQEPRIGCSTVSNADTDKIEAWMATLRLASSYMSSHIINEVPAIRTAAKEQHEAYTAEREAKKAAEDQVRQARTAALGKHDWTTSRFRIRKGDNWRSGDLRWKDPSTGRVLVLTETNGTETEILLLSDLAATLQVKDSTRYSNVF